jgi:hypothetical protein
LTGNRDYSAEVESDFSIFFISFNASLMDPLTNL